MASLYPSGVPPITIALAKRSFADVVATGGLDPAMNASQLQAEGSSTMSNYEKPTTGLHKGALAVFFPDSYIAEYAKPFRCAIVGKFSQGFNKLNRKLGRTPLEVIEKFLVALDLKAQFSVGLLDNRHVLINLRSEADFLRIYSKSSWYVDGQLMRI